MQQRKSIYYTHIVLLLLTVVGSAFAAMTIGAKVGREFLNSMQAEPGLKNFLAESSPTVNESGEMDDVFTAPSDNGDYSTTPPPVRLNREETSSSNTRETTSELIQPDFEEGGVDGGQEVMLEESVSDEERLRREEQVAERRERGYSASFETEGEEGDSERVFTFNWGDDEEDEPETQPRRIGGGGTDTGSSGDSHTVEGQSFRVQAGVFSQRENAEQQVAQLKRLLYAPSVAEVKTDAGTFWSVIVGTFRSREQAERLIGELRENGFDASLKVIGRE